VTFLPLLNPLLPSSKLNKTLTVGLLRLTTIIGGADTAGAGAAEGQAFTDLAPIKPAPTTHLTSLSDGVTRVRTDSVSGEDDIFRALSRRKTAGSGDQALDGESHEIERLLSTIFGQKRQATSDEEARHLGVVFKNLTVKGQGIGAALQPTNGDFFWGPVRALKGLFAGTALKPKSQVRTLLNDFSGCVRPQEMLLVLGRPGSGCSTFLKTIGNQRSGFEETTGEVTYGGVGWKDMWKKFRGEVLYNPEEDLHYATLTVRETLSFALKTRTPGKEGRAEGETKAMYVDQFLRVVSKVSELLIDTSRGNY
jgi:ATP-binding cassette subfamily G (WHITE) protein 2 (SNQ2)